jgi:hypothetical protein
VSKIRVDTRSPDDCFRSPFGWVLPSCPRANGMNSGEATALYSPFGGLEELGLLGHCSLGGHPMRLGPFPSDELSMPAPQRIWCDQR